MLDLTPDPHFHPVTHPCPLTHPPEEGRGRSEEGSEGEREGRRATEELREDGLPCLSEFAYADECDCGAVSNDLSSTTGKKKGDKSSARDADGDGDGCGVGGVEGTEPLRLMVLFRPPSQSQPHTNTTTTNNNNNKNKIKNNNDTTNTAASSSSALHRDLSTMLAAWRKNKPIPSPTHNNKVKGSDKGSGKGEDKDKGDGEGEGDEGLVSMGSKPNKLYARATVLSTRRTHTPSTHNSNTHAVNVPPAGGGTIKSRLGQGLGGDRSGSAFSRDAISHTSMSQSNMPQSNMSQSNMPHSNMSLGVLPQSNMSLGNSPHTNMTPGTAVAILQHWAYHGRLQPAVEAVAKMYNTNTNTN